MKAILDILHRRDSTIQQRTELNVKRWAWKLEDDFYP